MKYYILMFVLLLSAISLSIGCAFTSYKVNRQEFERTLDADTGKLSYDCAVSSWGQPTDFLEFDCVFLAVWGGSIYAGHQAPAQSGYTTRTGSVLKLIFDKNTEILQDWKYHRW
jgi:hypothetical protein